MMNKNSYWVTISSRGFTEDNLIKLISYNPDGVRINTGRDSYEWAKQTICFLIQNSYPSSKIFLDIGNNKPRIRLKKGLEHFITSVAIINIGYRDTGEIDGSVNSTLFFETLEKDDVVLIGDGEIKCEVLSNADYVATLHICNDGVITNLTAIGIEGKDCFRFGITPSEHRIIKEILINHKISLIVSFVKTENDVIWVEENFPEASVIMPKIETLSAVGNIEKIFCRSQLVLLGRGDLALSVGIEKLGIIQKMILEEAQKYRCNVVIASGTLESLLHNNIPNRSDIIDITNSYISGASGIMLTSETGASKMPFTVIDFLAKVIEYLVSEYNIEYFEYLK